MKSSHTKKIVIIGLLIAMEIVLTRLLYIWPTPAARYSLGFVPIAVMGILFGPISAGIGAAVSDFLGFTLFAQGTFFPGFTLTAFLAGATYGIFLHKKPASLWRIVAAALLVTLFLNFVLDTIWLYILLDAGVAAMLPDRIIRTAIMFPLQVVALRFITSRRFEPIFEEYQA